MAFISSKTIKGKKRHYLEKSIRLPNGKVKKFSVYIKNYNPKISKKEIESYAKQIDSKISTALLDFASEHYKNTHIFSKEELKKLEIIKLEYKELLKKISKKQLQDVIDRFAVNFTYESNAIEGNSLTLKDVTFVLQEKKAIKGKDLREVYETINTRNALGLIFNNKLKPVRKDIIRLHKILVKDTEVATGYKTLPNFLIGRDIKTALPENVESEMNQLIEWYNNNFDIHPLQRAAIFHGTFEKIHPFDDGNGRVGRLLINVMLLNHGYPPLIIRKTQRLSYFSCLEAFDKGHKDKIERFLVEKYKDTYRKFFEVYVKYI